MLLQRGVGGHALEANELTIKSNVVVVYDAYHPRPSALKSPRGYFLALGRRVALTLSRQDLASRARCRREEHTLTSCFPHHRQDAQIAGQATGAMSWAFIAALKKNPQQSYVSLLNSIRDELDGKYTQKPQLSCSHPLGMASDS